MLVDATAVPADRGGVGRYVDQLLPALGRRGGRHRGRLPARDVEHYGELLPAAEIVPRPAAIARRPARLAWEQTGLPALVRPRSGAQVLHSPHYTFPLRAGVPRRDTLHDATFFTPPEVHQPVKRAFFRTWTRASLRRAARCVVPSQATLDELARVTGAGARAGSTSPTTASTRATVPRARRRRAARPSGRTWA